MRHYYFAAIGSANIAKILAIASFKPVYTDISGLEAKADDVSELADDPRSAYHAERCIAQMMKGKQA